MTAAKNSRQIDVGLMTVAAARRTNRQRETNR